jgi:hypothetical protein
MNEQPEKRRTAEQVLEELKAVTLEFRDRLKEETGETLTVEDTQAALDAFELHARGVTVPSNLTDIQRRLLNQFIHRVGINR